MVHPGIFAAVVHVDEFAPRIKRQPVRAARRPIMDFQIQKGVTISSTLYAAKSHSPGMPWDFVIINVSPPEGEGPKLGMTRAEVLRKLFPDIEDYVKGERRRWELTVNHWDEDLVELDVTREPLSVYYPLDAPAKKK